MRKKGTRFSDANASAQIAKIYLLIPLYFLESITSYDFGPNRSKTIVI
jgi:hypothetical protein